MMFIITSRPFNFYDYDVCARVCVRRVLLLKSDPLWCRFLPSLSTAICEPIFLSLLFSAYALFFLFGQKKHRRQKTKNIYSYHKNTILNRLFKEDNTKKKRITTQDDDACYYYYYCYDDERDDD
jgi:hypothetical protein